MKPAIIVFTEHSDQRLAALLKKQGRSLPTNRGAWYDQLEPDQVLKMPLAALKQAEAADPASASDVDRILTMLAEA